MNRKSALFVAAGMVLTMVVAAAAMTMGIAGPSKADASVVRRREKPVVKTVVDTVTIHKKAKATGVATGTTVVRTAAPAPTTSTGDDPQSEPAEQESDDQETEDHETESPEPQETESPEPGESGDD